MMRTEKALFRRIYTREQIFQNGNCKRSLIICSNRILFIFGKKELIMYITSRTRKVEFMMEV